MFLAIGIAVSNAQGFDPLPGKVEKVQDQRMGALLDQYKKMNQQDQTIDGYRVQIFFDSGSNSKKELRCHVEYMQYHSCRVFLSFKRLLQGKSRNFAPLRSVASKKIFRLTNAFR
jgi:hypothetical protein